MKRYPFGEKPSPWDAEDDSPPSWILWGPLIGLGLWAVIATAIWAVM